MKIERLNRPAQEQMQKNASGGEQEDSAVQSNGPLSATRSSYHEQRQKYPLRTTCVRGKHADDKNK